MSSRPESEHLFIICNDTGDWQEKEDVDSLVSKPLRSFSDGAHKQVSNKHQLDYAKVSACSQTSPTDKEIKEISLWYGMMFIPLAMQQQRCWEQPLPHGKVQWFVTMGFAFNRHQELCSHFFYYRISAKQTWFCQDGFSEWSSLLFPGCLVQEAEVWCFHHPCFDFCPSVWSRCLSWDSLRLAAQLSHLFLSWGGWMAKERLIQSTTTYRIHWFELIFPH